jgi:hypothetical protein
VFALSIGGIAGIYRTRQAIIAGLFGVQAACTGAAVGGTRVAIITIGAGLTAQAVAGKNALAGDTAVGRTWVVVATIAAELAPCPRVAAGVRCGIWNQRVFASIRGGHGISGGGIDQQHVIDGPVPHGSIHCGTVWLASNILFAGIDWRGVGLGRGVAKLHKAGVYRDVSRTAAWRSVRLFTAAKGQQRHDQLHRQSGPATGG